VNQNKNIESLGSLFMDRIKKTNGAMQPLGIELGKINGDLSLSPDSSPGPIPKGEYMVCRAVNQGDADSDWTVTENDGLHDHSGGGHSQYSGSGEHTHTQQGPHVHQVKLPETFRTIKAGDRVLICWAGYTPVIVDIVYVS
jgi:hypothetical protein